VNRTGRLLWRPEGAFEESQGLGLRDALQELMESGSDGSGIAMHSSVESVGGRG
jgi:hypothetical protein